MKSLVTGAAGFAGGHLVRYLLERGDQVAGLIYPQEAGERPETLPEQVELFEADILEGEALVTVLSRWEPDAIYHLAAFSSPEDSWRQARRALETNILGCHNLLQG
ncbi:MAG: GDP-mannose 4,6-dehydratase, partial [Acidobacteriota bacterium]